MSRILIIAEHDGETLNPSTAKTLTGAQGLGIDDIDVAVFAADPSSVAEQAAKLEGVSRVLTIAGEDFAHALAARLAPEIKALADDYSHILAPSTTFGKDVLPRAAALIGVNQVSDIQEVIDERTFKRPIYAGNAIVTVKVADDQPVLATIRTASFAAAGEGGSAEIESRDAQLGPGPYPLVKIEGGDGEGPDLASAPVVVSGGRAMGSSEGFDIIYSLATEAQRRRRCLARCGRCRLCAQRAAGRSDRQDHCPGSLFRDRHFRRHPAPDRHQGRRHHRRHQQGRGSADLRGCRSRAGGGSVRDCAGVGESDLVF
jgi:electron transfer flavoprotein alpha subunit